MRKLTYLGATLSAVAYIRWVESKVRKYHPDETLRNVTIGIALTGAWVGVRFAVEPQPRSLLWAWCRMVLMFVATGIPVASWELLAKDGRGRHLLAYIRGHRDGHEASPTG